MHAKHTCLHGPPGGCWQTQSLDGRLKGSWAGRQRGKQRLQGPASSVTAACRQAAPLQNLLRGRHLKNKCCLC